MWGVTHLLVNQPELEITNPPLSALANWAAYRVVTGHLVADIMVRKYFKTGNHALILRERCEHIRRRNVHIVQAALEEAMVATPVLEYSAS